jgi:hypothetical protein
MNEQALHRVPPHGTVALLQNGDRVLIAPEARQDPGFDRVHHRGPRRALIDHLKERDIMFGKSLKFALGFALSLSIGGVAMTATAGDTPVQSGWFGKCLGCFWDPWGGPAYCSVAKGKGFYGCYANGYKCSLGGSPCGKTPIAVDGELPSGGHIGDAP